MNDSVIDADRTKTAARTAIKRLYQRQHILPSAHQKDFRCSHLDDCSGSRSELCTGNWPYIGAHYGEARVSGRRLRILFIAMERGGKSSYESFSQTQRGFRIYAEGLKNPHMGGTAQIMKFLVDNNKQSQLHTRQFALTNAVKCVEATGSQQSSSTATMISKCSEHLTEEIKCLKPHLVITQGCHPSQTIVELFHPKCVKRFRGQAGKAEVRLGEHLGYHFVILTTPHPAHKPGWAWKNGPLPKFLQNAVNCAIVEVKRHQR
jgi:uracil-DNA glycosylase family 4